MQLTHFTVNNYRSITKSEKLNLSSLTVLVGPNNEGKSNILRAMVVGMRALERVARGDRPISGRQRRMAMRHLVADEYDWERDYPLDRQASHPDGRTSLRFDFTLTDAEVQAFSEEVGSRINYELPIRIELGRDAYQISIPKKGPGKEALSAKRDAIAKFVGDRIDVAYIPAVRQAERSEEEVRRILDRELRDLETSSDFQEALKAIERVQEPILEQVSATLEATLKEFMPLVESASVSISTADRSRALRQAITISIDDGTQTPLELKGDGMQSLAALAITRYVTSEVGPYREIVLALEEPDSHLHPGASHQLRSVLEEIAQRQQVILTTHSPAFVNRYSSVDNIVVRDNRARPAADVSEVRHALGIRTSDNLSSAELVIVVEGTTDARILQALLAERLEGFVACVGSGSIAFEVLGGGGKLGYCLGRLQAEVCDYLALLDKDEQGRSAVQNAQSVGLLTARDYFLLGLSERQESEVEDCVDHRCYRELLQKRTGILLPSEFGRRRSKWSTRLQNAAERSGKDFDRNLANDCKQIVAECVEANARAAEHPAVTELLDAVASAITQRLPVLERPTN